MSNMQDLAAGLIDESPRGRVLRQLREQILSGRIGAGDPLPTERQIADAFGVARGTVRAALEALEKEKLIQARKHAKRIATPRNTPQAALLSRTYVILTSLTDEPRIDQNSGMLGAVEAGIFNTGRREGLHGLLLQQNSLEDGYLEMMLRSNPAGVLVASTILADPQMLTRLGKILAGTSLPLVINSASTELPECDRVIFDHAAGCAMLTKYFLRRGCRRILRIWSSTHTPDWLRERNRGYEEAMREAGLEPLPELRAVHLHNDRNDLPLRARCYAGTLVELLRGKELPEAILVTSDSDVFAVAAACRLCGCEPGEKLMIAGYDNNWQDAPELAITGYTPPATIDKHNFTAGEAMMRLLRQRQEKPDLPWQAALIPPELILT